MAIFAEFKVLQRVTCLKKKKDVETSSRYEEP